MSEFQPPSTPLQLVSPHPTPPCSLTPAEEKVFLQMSVAQTKLEALAARCEKALDQLQAATSKSPRTQSSSPSVPSSPEPKPSETAPSLTPTQPVSSASWPSSEPSSPELRPSETRLSPRPAQPVSSASSPLPPRHQDPVVTAVLAMLAQQTAHRPLHPAGLSRADRELLEQLQADVQSLKSSPRRSQSISELFSKRPDFQEALKSHHLDTLAAIRKVPAPAAPKLPSLLPVVRAAVVSATLTTLLTLMVLEAVVVVLVMRGAA